MIEANEICLVDCGQQEHAGTRHFCCEETQHYLLLLCGIRTIFHINEKQFYMQPFTFMIHPFEQQELIIETQELTAYRYLHLQCTDAYVDKLAQNGVQLMETHTLAQPLAVEEIWKLLQPFMSTKSDCISQEMGVHALHLLMCLLTEASDGSVSKAAEVPHYDKLTALRYQIYQNPAESWYIPDICEDLGLSRSYFHKIYMAAFGTTCTQDVIASRIACSKKMLEKTDNAVSVISQTCGFETDVYFMRQFKRRVGMTPTAYRRIFRQSSALQKKKKKKGDNPS